jgi:hypothetical protein
MAAVNETATMGALEGRWRIVREGGLLPPLMRKQIHNGKGRLFLGLIPIGRFEVVGTTSVTLVYRRWPLRDEITLQPDGTWAGRGVLLGGKEFCRFRMVPMPHRLLGWRRAQRLPAT